MNAELFLTREQVRRVDRLAIETYGIPGAVLMENAGRGAAAVIRATCPDGRRVAIACGPGNNGGDGFVIARHLANDGATVDVLIANSPERISGDARIHYGIVEKMNLPIHVVDGPGSVEPRAAEILRSADVIVDALLGTGFTGQPREPIASIIRAINAASQQGGATSPVTDAVSRPMVFAVDLPSGLDCDSGTAADPTVRADHTITFVAKKIGFKSPEAQAWLGLVHVVDIGAPAQAVLHCQKHG